MKTCPNCQSPVNDDQQFCSNCGAKLNTQQTPDIGANQDNTNNTYYAQQDAQQSSQYYDQSNNNAYNQQYYNNQQNNGYYAQPTDWGIKTTPYIVWSILNMILCCMPLGIWSLILCTTLNKKPTYEEAQKSLNTAKIVCIVGTVLGFVVEILYVAVMILGGVYF